MNIQIDTIRADITRQVAAALKEDIHTGDITAQLIPVNKKNTAEVITREECVVCGQDWVNETFHQIGNTDNIKWHVTEGEVVAPNTLLLTIKGNSRSLLTAERTALNFLQLLSGIATKAKHYSQWVKHTHIKILDTRKTLPGLRTAQKYAVAIGGCHNHRIGLFDAFLIKENHIAACGGIVQAITAARNLELTKLVEIEVESLEELQLALEGNADVIMLDNFSENMLEQISHIDKRASKYEVSGNIDERAVKMALKYNVDYISIGDLTKNNTVIDLSMRIL